MIDTLFQHLEAARATRSWEAMSMTEGEYGVTLHRPSNVDEKETLGPLVNLLYEIQNVFLVFPIHLEHESAEILDDETLEEADEFDWHRRWVV